MGTFSGERKRDENKSNVCLHVLELKLVLSGRRKVSYKSLTVVAIFGNFKTRNLVNANL